jgi:hypothetical protein
MGIRDPRVDACIAKSADFAKPILTHFRDVVHVACPDVETMKWGAPTFQLLTARRKNRKARAVFGAWAPSQRKEYTQWITEAKREDTRVSPVMTAVEWIADGKPRNWKNTPGRRS